MAVNNLNPAVVPPTAAEIATAVAAPSAATIAAAVAAPSAATIAAAVAAPSSATIASAVAAAVPTTAGITSIVQANAGSPFGGTWVNLALANPNGVTNVNITGLSGYRYYRVYAACENMSGSNRFAMRFNNDTGFNYNYFFYNSGGGDSLRSSSSIALSPNINGSKGAVVDIPSANSTSTDKMYFTLANGNSSSGSGGTFSGGVWASTAAITAITFFDTQGNTGNWYVRVLGSN